RFYGIGSGGGSKAADEPEASPAYVPAVRSSAGPDYTGFGSAPAGGSTDASGIDMSDALYTAGEKLSKARDWFGQKSEVMGGKIQNFLDEL
ncbi:hypothetical protein DIPPA_31780, partial [Diplonema papillatum]